MAGSTNQGTNAIAIGNSAGQTGQFAGSTVINAGGAWSADTTYRTVAGTFIRPLRALAAATAVYYNATTFELSYLTSNTTTKNTIVDLASSMDTNVIYDLSPKTYYYNTDPNAGLQVGYIAEEVRELNRHFATYDRPGGDPVAINYNAVVVFLVEEVKKLKKENIEINNRLRILESK